MKRKKNLFKDLDVIAFLGGLMVFLLIPPKILGVPGHFPPAKFLFVFLLLAKFDKAILGRGKDIIFAMMMSLLFFYMASKNIEETNLFGFVSTLFLPIMFWTRKDFLLSVFKSFTNVYAYFIIIPSIIYLLVLLGAPIPHTQEYSAEEGSTTYIQTVYLHICALANLRFAGYFDEPGVVGTFSGVLLVANQFKLKPFVMASLLFSGILSFSFAFYVIIFLYVSICSRSVKLISGIAIIAGILIIFYWDIFSTLILERVVFDEGDLVSNRTTRSFESWYAAFVQSDDYYWGLGNHISLYYDEKGASYKHLIVDYGIIFFVVFCSTLAFHAKLIIKNFNSWIAYLLVMVGILYQRPFIELHSYLFVLYASMITISYNDKFEINKDENRSIVNVPQPKRKNSSLLGTLLPTKQA